MNLISEHLFGRGVETGTGKVPKAKLGCDGVIDIKQSPTEEGGVCPHHVGS
jgi:hypothetical protein